MKYGYEVACDPKLIENYKISDDKIIVKLLNRDGSNEDGSNYEIPFTKENEIKLLNLMLEQAEKRNEKISIKSLKRGKKGSFIWIMLASGYLVYDLVSNHGINSGLKVAVNSCIMGSIIKEALDYKKASSGIKEIEKYDIYLQNKSELEANMSNPDLFDGVKKRKSTLNINTLDCYSLNDIKKIRDNLKTIQECSLDSDCGKNPVFVKKFDN